MYTFDELRALVDTLDESMWDHSAVTKALRETVGANSMVDEVDSKRPFTDAHMIFNLGTWVFRFAVIEEAGPAPVWSINWEKPVLSEEWYRKKYEPFHRGTLHSMERAAVLDRWRQTVVRIEFRDREFYDEVMNNTGLNDIVNEIVRDAAEHFGTDEPFGEPDPNDPGLLGDDTYMMAVNFRDPSATCPVDAIILAAITPTKFVEGKPIDGSIEHTRALIWHVFDSYLRD